LLRVGQDGAQILPDQIVKRLSRDVTRPTAILASNI
jgi:hypothetical protein